MNVFLMHRDRDFDIKQQLPPNEIELTEDLELTTLFKAMSLGDEFLFAIAKTAVLSSINDPSTILYRQDVFRDCLDNSVVVREMYDLAVSAIDGERRIYRAIFSKNPEAILRRSVSVLELFLTILKQLRHLVDLNQGEFRSEGFCALFEMLERELNDDYFHSVEGHLKTLRFRDGVLVSAQLGRSNKGTRYTLRLPNVPKQGWVKRIVTKSPLSYHFEISERDEGGLRSLAELEGRGVNLVANALAQSTDHILSFFNMLRSELAFYIGSLNLHHQLVDKNEPICFPVPEPSHDLAFSCSGLYDVCLSLRLDERVVGNDVRAHGKSLVVITGANRGGKSTFLRSVGLAHLMMQAGMFVCADAFRASVCNGFFSHYRREEDSAMNSGKLDEELKRMSDIADMVTPQCLILLNEPFSATYEREGSEIGRQVIRALLDRQIRVFLVTHLFDLSQGFYTEQSEKALFLRAERHDDGGRTFRLTEGKPLPTSFGEDLYERIFNNGLVSMDRIVNPQ